MGIGDWGLGVGGWGFGPIPQHPKPNPKTQNPTPKIIFIKKKNFKKKNLNFYFFKKIY